MRITLLLIAFFPISGCAISSERNNLSNFPIEKRIQFVGESEFFKYDLILPVGPDKNPSLPKSFDDAVSRLEMGLNPIVMDQLINILRESCGSKPCDYSSPSMWDVFISGMQKAKIESRQTLSSYIFRTSEFLGRSWHLDPATCKSEESFCRYLTSNFSSSPDMFADIIIRAAIANKSGNPATLEELVSGMGDMVEKKSPVDYD